MSAPRSTHNIVVLCISCYVKGTLFHDLHFSYLSSLELRAYSDADEVGNLTNWHSTANYYFLLGTSLVLWFNKKQSVITISSTEAKYHALADTISVFLWLR